MTVVLHRELSMPIWAIAFCAVLVSGPSRAAPTLLGLAGVAALLSAIPMAVRQWRRRAVAITELPPAAARATASVPAVQLIAGTHVRTFDEVVDAAILKKNDASDLVRMNDDGGPLAARPGHSGVVARG